jgi:hypothetical protein
VSQYLTSPEPEPRCTLGALFEKALEENVRFKNITNRALGTSKFLTTVEGSFTL